MPDVSARSRTVVGWDGRAAARAALGWAVAHAAPGDAIELVQVLDEFDGDDDALTPEQTRERAALFAEAARIAVLRPELVVTGSHVVGDPEQVLLQRAGRGGTIVLGAPRPVWGSHAGLARRLAERQEASVALIHEGYRSGPVLVGVGPGTERTAVLAAAELAERGGTDLVLLRGDGLGRAGVLSATELVAVVRAAHPELHLRVVLSSRPPVDALEEAVDQVSLIVLGPRLRGSGTRESLIERAACALLLLGTDPAGGEQDDVLGDDERPLATVG
ncbi:hypothetical protein [Amnibacterium sp.]|uniref:hypothetical protein n=1 Tax=Amnibacterium sp. TaxID=1872496 RepID=UPI003F7CAFF7